MYVHVCVLRRVDDVPLHVHVFVVHESVFLSSHRSLYLACHYTLKCTCTWVIVQTIVRTNFFTSSPMHACDLIFSRTHMCMCLQGCSKDRDQSTRTD